MGPSVEPFNDAKYKALMDGLECSEVLLSKLEEGYRVDAELYQKKYVKLNEFAEIHDHTFFINESDIVKKGIFSISASCYSNDGVPFIRISNLKNMFISTEDLVLIPEDENNKHADTELHEGDIILSKTGSPAASYVDIPKCNVSQDTVAIRLKNTSQVCSEFVVVYLNTKYGIAQMEKRFTGNIQMHLNLNDCKSRLIIPKFGNAFQNTIARVFLLALESRRFSISLYQKAKDQLHCVLEIDEFEHSTINCRVMQLKDSFFVTGRLDAEYYQAKYDYYTNSLARFKTTSIPNEFNVYKNSGSNYADGISDVGVIKTKQLIDSGINCDGIESYFSKEACTENRSTFVINNDVIFASMGVGSLGKVSLFSHNGDKQFVTDSTLRIYRAKETSRILPEVLCVFLQSPICQELIYRYVVGSTGIINIYDYDMAKIPIPILEKEIQKDIAEKVQESFALRRRSKQLLEYAKQAVEMAIEHGEDVALAWIEDKLSKMEV